MEEISDIRVRYTTETFDDVTDFFETSGRVPGIEALEALDSRVTLVQPAPPPEIPAKTTSTRAILVISPGTKPTLHGVKMAESEPVESVSAKLHASLGLGRDEILIFGYTNDSNRIGGFLSPGSPISCDMFLHNRLTVWRTTRSPTYVSVNFYEPPHTHGITPTFIVGVSAGPVNGHAMTPEDDQAVMNEIGGKLERCLCPAFCDDATDIFEGNQITFANLPDTVSSPVCTLAIWVFLAPEKVYRSEFRKYRGTRIHDSPIELRRDMMDTWTHAARRTHRDEVLRHQDTQNLRDIMNHNPWYRYEMRVVPGGVVPGGGEIRIRVFSKAGRWTHCHPVMDETNNFRWELAKTVSAANPYTAWIDAMQYMEMPDDFPEAPQPQTCALPLKRHQLQNLHFMMDRENDATFHADRYTKLPPTETGPVLFYDPISKGTTIARVHSDLRATGGFLCDPMGSGKTACIISLIASNRATVPGTPRATLVVCPPSVIGQWAREISVVAPGLVAYTYHGKKRAGVNVADLVADRDVVLTTYATYVLAYDVLHPAVWHRVVFDESHTMSARFASNAPKSHRRWCVTATPRTYHERQMISLRYPLAYGDSFATCFYTLQPMTIYRGSTEHTSDLPPLENVALAVDFSEAEKQLYEFALRAARESYQIQSTDNSYIEAQALLRPLRAICSGGIRMSAETVLAMIRRDAPPPPAPDKTLICPADDECAICYNIYEQPTVTPCSHWFCRVCISTALARSGQACPLCRRALRPSDLRLGVHAGTHTDDPEDAGGGDTGDGGDGAISCTSKIDAVIRLLEEIRAEDPTNKTLVFGHSNDCLRHLRPLLAQRGFGVRTIHGGMAAAQRSSAITSFQTDPRTTVFLLGSRAASTGINLTAANRIIVIDPGFDASETTQGIGRAHRFGQQRPVHVTRLHMRDSVESLMLLGERSCVTLAKRLFQ